jgi:hypothetical protein
MTEVYEIGEPYEHMIFHDVQQFQAPTVVENHKISGSSTLSEEEFHSLIKSIQLLRISQLRYIVQKFSIPASGNKTKLLSLVIQIFHNLRFDPILSDIYQEIGNLLAQQDAPFSAPTFNTSQLELVQPNSDFIPTFNVTITILSESPVFGPLLAKPGRTSGKFTFLSPPINAPTIVTFLFYQGNAQPFSIQFQLNGILFEISKDDPQPAPIDVANVLSAPGVENILDIKSVNTTVPVMIQLFQYEYTGIKYCIQRLIGQTDITKNLPYVKTNTCQHEKSFSLVSYLSDSLATGNWMCPVCGADAQLQNLVLTNFNQNHPSSPHDTRASIASTESMFGLNSGDIFHGGQIDQFDWDTY